MPCLFGTNGQPETPLRSYFPRLIIALIPFVITGFWSGLASAQTTKSVSVLQAGDQEAITSGELKVYDCNPCNGRRCFLAHRCPLTGILKSAGSRFLREAPLGTLSQHYPYQALQMSYYARPYNASYYAALDKASYSGDVFETARLDVLLSLPKGTNLEYADGPRRPRPEK